MTTDDEPRAPRRREAVPPVEDGLRLLLEAVKTLPIKPTQARKLIVPIRHIQFQVMSLVKDQETWANRMRTFHKMAEDAGLGKFNGYPPSILADALSRLELSRALVGQLMEQIEAAKSDTTDVQEMYDGLVTEIETHLQEFIHDGDEAAYSLYCEAIQRVGEAIPHLPDWFYLEDEEFPPENQWVVAAYIDEDEADKHWSTEAMWDGEQWHSNHVHIDLDDVVYAWTWLPTPPKKERVN